MIRQASALSCYLAAAAAARVAAWQAVLWATAMGPVTENAITLETEFQPFINYKL